MPGHRSAICGRLSPSSVKRTVGLAIIVVSSSAVQGGHSPQRSTRKQREWRGGGGGARARRMVRQQVTQHREPSEPPQPRAAHVQSHDGIDCVFLLFPSFLFVVLHAGTAACFFLSFFTLVSFFFGLQFLISRRARHAVQNRIAPQCAHYAPVTTQVRFWGARPGAPKQTSS